MVKKQCTHSKNMICNNCYDELEFLKHENSPISNCDHPASSKCLNCAIYSKEELSTQQGLYCFCKKSTHRCSICTHEKHKNKYYPSLSSFNKTLSHDCYTRSHSLDKNCEMCEYIPPFSAYSPYILARLRQDRGIGVLKNITPTRTWSNCITLSSQKFRRLDFLIIEDTRPLNQIISLWLSNPSAEYKLFLWGSVEQREDPESKECLVEGRVKNMTTHLPIPGTSQEAFLDSLGLKLIGEASTHTKNSVEELVPPKLLFEVSKHSLKICEESGKPIACPFAGLSIFFNEAKEVDFLAFTVSDQFITMDHMGLLCLKTKKDENNNEVEEIVLKEDPIVGRVPVVNNFDREVEYEKESISDAFFIVRAEVTSPKESHVEFDYFTNVFGLSKLEMSHFLDSNQFNLEVLRDFHILWKLSEYLEKDEILEILQGRVNISKILTCLKKFA